MWDLTWKLYNDSDFVQDIKNNYVYTCPISSKMDLPYAMKYIAENEPMEDDISYPEISLSASDSKTEARKLENTIEECLKSA